MLPHYNQEKIVFTFQCNPSLAYIAVRDLQSSQHNASVQALLLAGDYCTTNSGRELARERWQTFQNSWKNNTIFNEHPIRPLCQSNRISRFRPIVLKIQAIKEMGALNVTSIIFQVIYLSILKPLNIIKT